TNRARRRPRRTRARPPSRPVTRWRLWRNRRGLARRGHRGARPGRDRSARGRARRGGGMKLIYETSQAGRRASVIPRPEGLPVADLPEELRRAEPPRLPEVPEFELVRHFTELSTR